MSNSTFLIRSPGNLHPQGPFSIPELQNLASSHHISPTTLVHDPSSDSWVSFRNSPSLYSSIFLSNPNYTPQSSPPFPLNPQTNNTSSPPVHFFLHNLEFTNSNNPTSKPYSLPLIHAFLLAILLILNSFSSIPLFYPPHTLPSFHLKSLSILQNPFFYLSLLDLLLAFPLLLGSLKFIPYAKNRLLLGIPIAPTLLSLAHQTSLIPFSLLFHISSYLIPSTSRSLPAILLSILSILSLLLSFIFLN